MKIKSLKSKKIKILKKYYKNIKKKIRKSKGLIIVIHHNESSFLKIAVIN